MLVKTAMLATLPANRSPRLGFSGLIVLVVPVVVLGENHPPDLITVDDVKVELDEAPGLERAALPQFPPMALTLHETRAFVVAQAELDAETMDALGLHRRLPSILKQLPVGTAFVVHPMGKTAARHTVHYLDSITLHE
jgi:hypothetical protein